MAFTTPRIDPFGIPKEVGSTLTSRYLFNNYRIEFDVSWWRTAVDNGLHYSDLSYLDVLYSWCMQSSPFLVSQINKRVNPIKKARFELKRADGTTDHQLTKQITNTRWFKELILQIMLSKFYGVRMIAIDVENDDITIYPMRNIDIINKAIRWQTYEYFYVAKADDYDNVFFFQPSKDPDQMFGMLMPISRAMIGINESYGNWRITAKRYSYPKMTVGYIANDDEAKTLAEAIAMEPDPTAVPIIEFTYDETFQSSGNREKYKVKVEPVRTDSMPDAFRTYKEYISEYRGEIMQLVTGGTLLGATEKNTNSEQLAQIHLDLYKDIIEGDVADIASTFTLLCLPKLAKLLRRPEIEEYTLENVPDNSISMAEYKTITDGMSKMGWRTTAKFFAKVGLDPETDIDTKVRDDKWVDVAVQKKTMLDKILNRNPSTPKTTDKNNNPDG